MLFGAGLAAGLLGPDRRRPERRHARDRGGDLLLAAAVRGALPGGSRRAHRGCGRRYRRDRQARPVRRRPGGRAAACGSGRSPTWRSSGWRRAPASPAATSDAAGSASILGSVSTEAAADQLLEGLNEPQREAVLHGEGPLLILAGRRLGQDARAHPPDRPPGAHRAGAARRDPRDHLHEQGRAGDARAGGGAGGRPRARDVGDDLPLGLRADAARRRRAARLHARLHDLRRAGLAAAGQELHRGAGRRSQALRPARHPAPDLGREEPAARRRGLPAQGGVLLRADRRRRLRALRAAPARARTRWTSTTCCSAA